MSRLNWFDAPAPAERLAVLRVLTGAFATAYLAVRLPAFHALADAPERDFEPVGVLWWLPSTVAPAAVTATIAVGLVAGAAFTAGAWFRVSGPAFAIAFLALTTYRSSFGQLLWFENLVVLHLLIVACTPSADAVAVDARRRPVPQPRAGYGWSVRLAALVTVSTYFLAGVAKLREGGRSWLAGDTLVNHVAYSAGRLEVLGASASPLAELLVRAGWLLTPAAVITIALELGAPLALMGGRIRDGWVVGTWLLHAGIAATMFVVFPYPLALVAFAPLYDLERLVPRRQPATTSGWWRRTSSG